jgi:ribosomal protein L35AE/L33A
MTEAVRPHRYRKLTIGTLALQQVRSNLINSLYAKGRVLGHTRGKRNQKTHTSLLQIEGCATRTSTDFYLGKRVAFVYRAKREIDGSKIRF